MSQTKYVKIQTKWNATTGLIAAFCDEIPGLLVVGISPDDIERKLPGAIAEIMQAAGLVVLSVDMMRPPAVGQVWHEQTIFEAKAQLEVAA